MMQANNLKAVRSKAHSMEVNGTRAAPRQVLFCLAVPAKCRRKEEGDKHAIYSSDRRRIEAFHENDYTPLRLEAEAEAVRRLYMDGVVRQIWHRGDIGGACLLTEAQSSEDVTAALSGLPLFAAGMQEAVAIVPLRPYRGFSPKVDLGGSGSPLPQD
jgi:muconolactone delta-isomerase